MQIKGINASTGTVHYGERDSYKGLVQLCGIKADQHLYLSETDADVTCKRCIAMDGRKAKKAVKPAQARKTFGALEWTLTDLRELAALSGIQGFRKMDGETLMKEIATARPDIATQFMS